MVFEDPQGTLYLVLAGAVILLTIFLCVTLIYLILILRDTSQVLGRVRDTVERINAFVIKPVAIAAQVVDRVRPIIEAALHRRVSASTSRKRKS